MLLPVLLVAAALATAADTIVHRYQVAVSVRSEVDLTGLGMPAQIQEQSAVAFLTFTLADSATGRSMLAVVDSATLSAGDLPVPPDAAMQARGTSFRGFIDAHGQVQGLRASTENPIGGMVESLLGDFFPRLPAGEKGPWQDTVQLASRINGGEMRTTVVTEYRTAGTEDFHGTAAQKVAAAFTTTMDGTIGTPGGDAGMRGTGSGTGNYYVTSDGIFLGGSRTGTQMSTVTMAAGPAPIPVRTMTVLVVTPLP